MPRQYVYQTSRLSRDREVAIPAYAGIQNFLERRGISNWIPAFAGMTGKVLIPKVSHLKWEACLPQQKVFTFKLLQPYTGKCAGFALP